MEASQAPPSAKPPVLVLYGGSFDPVHRGHTGIARAALEALDPERLLFLPCAQSPHKSDQPPNASGQDRVNMLKLACSDIDRTEVDDFELHQTGPSFTWRTLSHFRKLHPDHTLVWIVGADQWQNILNWAEPSFLRRNACYAVVPRDDSKITAHPGWQYEVIETRHPANSSAIRAALASGAKTHPHLHPPVARYIASHSLYTRANENGRNV